MFSFEVIFLIKLALFLSSANNIFRFELFCREMTINFIFRFPTISCFIEDDDCPSDSLNANTVTNKIELQSSKEK